MTPQDYNISLLHVYRAIDGQIASGGMVSDHIADGTPSFVRRTNT